jgi:transcriptional regulator with XRE-family HTH domain
MSFSSRLKKLREETGLSQSELADRAGLHRFGLAKLEQGLRQPTWETVQALAKALGVTCLEFTTEAEVTDAKPAPRGRSRKLATESGPAKPRRKKKGE